MTDVAARSDPGLVRERNEDRWLVRTRAGTTLLAVADGVGGTEGGEIASTAAIEAIGSTFVAPSYRESSRTSLADAVQAANAAVLEAAGRAGLPNAATTLVAVAVRGSQAVIANLGDSRAYLVRGTEVRQLTTDHSGDTPRSITRFAGDGRGAQPDIFMETLQPGDRLVLCSDGLTRHVTDPEISAAVARPAAEAADALVALARARGGLDNVTVVVYAAGKTTVSRALVGTLILALLILIGIAGSLGVLVAAPVGPSSQPSASPGTGPLPTVTP